MLTAEDGERKSCEVKLCPMPHGGQRPSVRNDSGREGKACERPDVRPGLEVCTADLPVENGNSEEPGTSELDEISCVCLHLHQNQMSQMKFILSTKSFKSL